MNKYVIGVDYGTDSVRCLIVNTKNGEEVASRVEYYLRWKQGLFCDPAKNSYRQHPLDYVECLEKVVRGALSDCAVEVIDNVVSMSFDTTCSTPVIINKDGMPLALLDNHKDNPNAMFVLWKDHTAIRESDEINDLAHRWNVDYTKYVGGIYSCEWVWAKVLHILRIDDSLRADAYSWIEHCDWMSALLTGNTVPEKVVRSRCAAGHKAMWHESWGGLPSEEFLTALDPLLSGFRAHLFTETYTGDTPAGHLTAEWADKLGLREGIAVGVGAIDCHVGSVGAQIESDVLVKTIGTSTCDIIMTDYANVADRVVRGICGQVDGSVVPGYIGMEAGQSAFGDIYAWFGKVLLWSVENIDSGADIEKLENMILPVLTRQAQLLDPLESTVLVLDWFNGRRTPDANPRVTGALTGLTLATTPAMIFRALVEATAFGSRAINERLLEEGVKIREVVALGGIARKSPFVMQIMSDVMGLPLKVAATDQTCAFGAAMFASVAAGVYETVAQAQLAMGKGFDANYTPNPQRAEMYNVIYEKYKALGAFAEIRDVASL